MKYRMKPLVVDAIQWDGQNKKEITKFMGLGYASFIHTQGGSIEVIIDTLNGSKIGRPGDYIVKGIAGEFFTCKPDAFEASYEKVDDETTSKSHCKKVMETGHEIPVRNISTNELLKIKDQIELEKTIALDTIRHLKTIRIGMLGDFNKARFIGLIDNEIAELMQELGDLDEACKDLPFLRESF